MTVINDVNSTCAECGVEFKKGYGITTGFSQARWKFLCKDCYSKITTDVVEEATKKLQAENKILEKHILELQADKGRLTDEVREYESEAREVNIRFDNAIKRLAKAKALLKETLCYLDLTDCVNDDPRLILYNYIEQFIK